MLYICAIIDKQLFKTQNICSGFHSGVVEVTYEIKSLFKKIFFK